jgi:hypothetical protein
VESQTEKYSNSIHLVNKYNNEKKIAKQTRKTRWIVMMIAMAEWIAKTKECKSAYRKK